MQTQNVELTKEELKDLVDALKTQRLGWALFGLTKKDKQRLDELYGKMYVEHIKKI